MALPIESMPRQECPFHSGGAFVGDANEGAEFANDRSNSGPIVQNFAPDPDFFQADYRKAAAPPSGAGKSNAPTEVVVSTNTPEDDDALANAEAVDDNEPREPGVVMREPSEFRETY